MLHIPLLRKGVPYVSLDVARPVHHQTGRPFVEVSQANVGLIRRDLLDQDTAWRALQKLPVSRLLEICREAADRFLADRLLIGDAVQSTDDYLEQLNATTGMPFAMGRRNMQKIAGVLRNMEAILAGLTRNLDLGVLDTGHAEANGQVLSFFPRAKALGVVLPSNSPGVHGLWAPSIALKMPLVLKPGGSEPWTPYRMIQAFIAGGCPPEAFSYYPSSHAGAGEIVRQAGRSMFFGDTSTVGAFAGDPRIEIHGPGFSKVIVGRDHIDRWPDYIGLMAESVAANGGRSCINASGVWVPSHAAEVADALAARLAAIVPLAPDDERAALAPFVDPRVAERISRQIDAGLEETGAQEATAAHRDTGRLVTVDGRTYLLPTVIHCDSPSHPLANREFLFPYVAVVEAPAEEMPDCLGQTLVVTAITDDPGLRARLLASDLVGRLNLGPIPTPRISWDQPHEGNLFELLYGRRALQEFRI